MTRPRRSLKKRRSEDNVDQRTKSITLEPVPGHRFPLVVIQLCVLIYMCTPCGLRTVVTIQETFAELLGDTFGKVPCYNTVENWVKKLGLSVYQDDKPCIHQSFHVWFSRRSMRNNLILWSLRHSLARNDCSIIWPTRHTCYLPTWEPYHGSWTCLHGYYGGMKCLTEYLVNRAPVQKLGYRTSQNA